MNIVQNPMHTGAAFFNKPVLMLYDFFVWGLISPYLLNCPADDIIALYNNHVSGNHLDIGVGTGYHLNRCRFPSGSPRLGLMDLNPSPLETAGRILSRYSPETYVSNVLEPVEINVKPFDSIGITYLLHCLPGTMKTKSVIFENLKKLLGPEGTLFGATVLPLKSMTSIGKLWIAILNRLQIFTNKKDSVEDLTSALSASFTKSHVEIVGSVALFWGTNKSG